jgi:hypothetical protein
MGTRWGRRVSAKSGRGVQLGPWHSTSISTSGMSSAAIWLARSKLTEALVQVADLLCRTSS